MATKKKTEDEAIPVQAFKIELDIKKLVVTLTGATPFVPGRMPPETLKEIEEKQKNPKQGQKTIKKARDFDLQYEQHFYYYRDDGNQPPGYDTKGVPELGMEDKRKRPYGIPSRNIKKCLLEVSPMLDQKGLKVAIGRAIFITGDVLPIKYDRIIHELEAHRIGGGTADPRHVPVFYGWEIKVPVEYDPRIFDRDTIVNLFYFAGRAQGLGEGRPGSPKNKAGTNGMFHPSGVIELK